MPPIRLKRIYDAPSPTDGRRVLVERLWPRGVTKEQARVDLWLRDLAPSPALRKWYGHAPARWESFRKRYHAELAGQAEVLDRVREMAAAEPVTFLFASREEHRNSAVALLAFLEGVERSPRGGRRPAGRARPARRRQR